MNKVVSYLQEHLDGEVLNSLSLRKTFSTDASIFSKTPVLVVYPMNTSDVRKTMRFAWQLAERGHVISVTARGGGSDQGGAAIGKGIMLVFPAHMNKLFEIDTRQNVARLQPGINYQAFEQTINTHGRTLPPFPASIQYATIGGAIANNSGGEKSVKYGAMEQYVDKLEVVLANGEMIQTGRLSAKELDKKKGETGFEAEIYRKLDGLIVDNWDVVQSTANHRINRNNAGYNVADVKHADGSIDLTPLFIGSQGTLGIISEAIVKLARHTPSPTMLVAELESLELLHDAVSGLLPFKPSVMEMIDGNLIDFVRETHPNRLKGISDEKKAAAILFIEFDDEKSFARKSHTKKAIRLLKKMSATVHTVDSPEDFDRWRGVRYVTSSLVNYQEGAKTSLPIMEDGIVPIEELQHYIEQTQEMLAKYSVEAAIWGHVGEANLKVRPLLDLTRVGDRQKVIKLIRDHAQIVKKLHGSISAENNDGRLHALVLDQQYDADVIALFSEIKKIFDPHDILNPDVKRVQTIKEFGETMRKDYSLAHLGQYLPRT